MAARMATLSTAFCVHAAATEAHSRNCAQLRLLVDPDSTRQAHPQQRRTPCPICAMGRERMQRDAVGQDLRGSGRGG